MTKAELEEAFDRVCKESNFYYLLLQDIKKVIEPVADVVSRGLADDTPYNQGVINALSEISDTINARLKPNSFLRYPTFKNNLVDTAPAFTIIEGGLSKKKKKESDNG